MALFFLHLAGLMLCGSHIYLEGPYSMVAFVNILFGLEIVVLTGMIVGRAMRSEPSSQWPNMPSSSKAPNLQRRKLPKLK